MIDALPDYQISSLGRIRRITYYRSTWRGRVLKPYTARGYRIVTLFHAGVRFRFPVHVLVARTFIANPQNLPQVNHKDLDKAHNTVSNLEWMTATDNHQHALAYGLWNKPHKNAKHVHKHRNKWQVAIQGKYYGTFATRESAEIKRLEVLNT